MKKPLLKDLYYEAYNLRNQIYDLLKPDIVMLNSNPLIKKSEKKNLNPNLRIQIKKSNQISQYRKKKNQMKIS